ncbi:MAG: hypothetical protein WCF07_06875 [Nitrososphaeraceae archaeon]
MTKLSKESINVIKPGPRSHQRPNQCPKRPNQCPNQRTNQGAIRSKLLK